MLCIEIAKGVMTKKEVERAMLEVTRMSPEDPHLKEIEDLKNEKFPEPKLNIINDYFPVYDEMENGDE